MLQIPFKTMCRLLWSHFLWIVTFDSPLSFGHCCVSYFNNIWWSSVSLIFLNLVGKSSTFFLIKFANRFASVSYFCKCWVAIFRNSLSCSFSWLVTSLPFFLPLASLLAVLITFIHSLKYFGQMTVKVFWQVKL